MCCSFPLERTSNGNAVQVFIISSPFVLGAFFVTFLIVFLVQFLRGYELSSLLLRWGLFVSVALMVTRGIVYSVAQYWAFQTGALQSLPFDQLVTYTIRYSALHYFSSFFLGLAIALFLFIIFWVLEKSSHGRLLDTNERYLVVFGALSAGWPGAALYAIGVFILPLAATPWLAKNFRERRVRLAPFIIISALLARGLTPFILPYAPWLEVLVCRTCI